MRLDVVDGPPSALAERAAVWLAERMWAAVDDRGVAHVAVSGGTTPKAMFEVLARLPVPWSSVHVWQVDERVAPAGDPARNLIDLEAGLLSKVPVTAHLFAVTDPDLDAAAARYAAELDRTCGGVLDAVHLGLGGDGHTASWPPGDPVAEVTDRDAAVSAVYEGHRRLTLTVPAVNRAHEIMFLVGGSSKVRAVAELVQGTGSIPALHVRRDATLLVDRAALPR
jgi:6-phosphogluconolactonase